MKRLLGGTMFLALLLAFPLPTVASVDVGVSISLPPLIVFAAPPAVVVIPETNVYVVPDLDADIFFYSGWWWRPWEGRWYRSRNYRSDWVYYRSVPSFYRGIPSGWRNDYRENRWRGRQWNPQRIPHQQLQRNWRNWDRSKHWEKKNSWGVQGLKPQRQSRPQSREASQPQRSRAVQPQRSQPQSREATRLQRSQPRQGKQEHGEGGRNDRK